VAVLVGGLEVLSLVGDRLGLTESGGFWGAIGSLSGNFGILGFAIVGIFIAVWLISYIVYRVNRYDEIEIRAV
jgi:high-affinity nickel-transport protein